MASGCDVQVEAERGEALERSLASLLCADGDLAYANFAPIAGREGASAALHAGRWRNAATALGAFVARDAAGRPLAALRLDRRPFESEHFALPMAVIDAPVGTQRTELREPAVDALLGAAFACARAHGIAHVAVRASSNDIATSRAAQRHAAVHVGTQVSWMLALDGHPHEPLPPGFDLETHAPESLADSESATWKRIAEWGARSFDRSPYAFDATLPAARSLAVYQAWTEKVMRGEWCDRVVLVRHAGEVVAFISYQLLRDVTDAAGIAVIGRCLAATLPEYRGMATACVREIAATRPLGASYLEGETPVTTFGTINLFAKTGFRYLRATAHFHRRFE